MTLSARILLPLALLALAASQVGCGSSAPEALALEPNSPVVQVGERLVLRAEPTEDLAADPEWVLMEYNGGGLLSTKGLSTTYLAPNHAGTFHLVIQSKRPDGSPVKVQRDIRVIPLFKPEPASALLRPGQAQTFSVKVKGLARSEVTWKAEGGSFNEGGIYVAPTEPGTYKLTATSVVDSSVSAVVTVVVN